MNDKHSSVITLQEVALKAKDFANFLEDFGFQNPEAVTADIQALQIQTLPE